MPARVTFAIGRSGAGKTRFVQERIRELLSRGETAALIVPEQFTFETERRLSDELGGLMGVSVYSFTTFARRALKETGAMGVFLSPQGRLMAVRKAIEENSQHLSAFARVMDRPGFAAQCDGLFTMCKRFEVSPADLASASGALSSDAEFSQKLSELSLLYEAVESHLAGRYMDTEDVFTALRAALGSTTFCGGNIFIDGFDMLTEQLYSLMEQLMGVAGTLTVTFRVDHSALCRDKAVFLPELGAYSRLYNSAGERGCEMNVVRLPLDGAPCRYESPLLAHLEHEAFAYPFEKYAGKSDGSIRLFAATDKATECAAAAEAVLERAQSGVRFRDIAVVASDPSYMGELARAFRQRGIPCFSDAAHPLKGYGAPRLILAALRLIHRGFTLPELMNMMRTGLAGVTPEQADIFENYALAYGIRGTAFLRPFERGEVPPEAEAARAIVMGPIAEFRGALSAAATAGEKAAALFQYMQRLELHSKLSALCASLREEGRLELAEENAQVYANILTVLDQLHAIMGDVRLSNARFAAVLEEGFLAYEISAIPATADQVLLGSVGKTRARDVKALFVLGANDGLFPRYGDDDAMISDEELARLAEAGFNVWDSSMQRAEVELMDVYCAISKPRQMLYLSYTMSAGSDAAPPAPVFDRIRELFPDIPLETSLSPALPRSEGGGFLQLADGLRRLADLEPPSDTVKPLYGWFAGRPQYADSLQNVESALYYRCSPEPFGHELSLKLYGDALYGSATRLEAFNSCAFRHFVSYGLAARPRKEYKERKADEGAFCHAALDAFLREAAKGDIRTLSDEECDKILDGILPALISAHNNGVLMDSPRGLALCARLCRAVKATARAVVRQAKESGFAPEKSEVNFGMGQYPALRLSLPTGESYLLSGRIDRIDGATVEGEKYYRVVDYKSGSTAFDYTMLYHGLKLQLPLYVAAVAAVEKLARPAGMYYMPIDDPVTADDDSPLEKRISSAFRMSGLTLSDLAIVQATAGSSGIIATGSTAKGFATANEFQSTVNFALQKSAETFESIFSGRADVAPADVKGRTFCDNCDARNVCFFDTRLQGCAARKLCSINRDAFFKAISKEDDNA